MKMLEMMLWPSVAFEIHLCTKIYDGMLSAVSISGKIPHKWPHMCMSLVLCSLFRYKLFANFFTEDSFQELF